MAAVGMVSKMGLVAAVLMWMVVVTPHQHVEGLTCGQVTGSLGPCIGYLKSGGAVPPPCCAGVRKLNGLARTTPDRKTACTCLKSIAGSIRGLNYGIAAGLPGKCGVSIPYKISPSTDCSRVQ